MRIRAKYFSDDFREKYNLNQKINCDGYIYCVIQKGMYGLKQEAILAYKQLVKNLKNDGYKTAEGTTRLWHHKSKPTKFALCVDDFGVKYFSKNDAEHLIKTLKKNYIISEEWSGKNCQEKNIAASTSIGIMTRRMSISACRSTYKKR